MPKAQDPAEGSRKVTDRELARQDGGSVKNPEQEAEHPGGRPSKAVKGSGQSSHADPEGQQGSSRPSANHLANPQRGN